MKAKSKFENGKRFTLGDQSLDALENSSFTCKHRPTPPPIGPEDLAINNGGNEDYKHVDPFFSEISDSLTKPDSLIIF